MRLDCFWCNTAIKPRCPSQKLNSGSLSDLDLVYVHVVDHSALGAPHVPLEIKQAIRKEFKNTVILAGGHTKESAEAELQSGLADLVAFGRPFINNPDLVDRMQNDLPLSTDLHFDLFYTPDEKGYTDYPVYQQ